MHRLLVSYRSIWISLFIQACGGAMAPSESTGSAGAGRASGPVGGNHIGPNAGGSLTGPAGGNGSISQGGAQTSPLGGASTGSTGSTGFTGYGGTGATGYGGTGATGYGGATSATGYGGTGATGRGGTGPTGYGGTGATGYGGTGSTGAGGSTGPATVVTSAEGDYWNVRTVAWGPTGSGGLTIWAGATGTAWDGFGGAFNEMAWHYLSLLSEAERDRAMRLLFGADGANFAVGGIPIGASDFAMDRYTHDELPSDSPYDYAMEQFSIDRDRKYLIPYIKAALAVRSTVRFWAIPWTPPTWMKDNSSFDGGNLKDDMQVLGAYALYLAKFVEAYKQEGIAIEAVHVQNEPGYAQTYPSCLWTAALTTRFISRYLGPTFGERGLNTQLFLSSMSNPDHDPPILDSVLNDATAMSYAKGFGLQGNMLNGMTRLKYLGRPVTQTAHGLGSVRWPSPSDAARAPNDYAYALKSWIEIRDWINAGVTSYTASHMVLDTEGKGLGTTGSWPQNALLTVDVATKTLNVTPTYFVFRHVSQFVEPGARVFPSNTDALTFRNPNGTFVAVLHNSDATREMSVTVDARSVKFVVPGDGWATVFWKN